MRREQFLAQRAVELRRLAHQLTGDPARADAAVVEAASRLPARAALERFDRFAARQLVRAAKQLTGPGDPGDALAVLPRRARHATVLAFGLGWDPDTMAEVLRRRPHAVQRDVASALRVDTEDRWRALLAEPHWGAALGAPDPGAVDVAAARRRATRTSLRIRRSIAAGASAVALAGATVAVVRVVTAPPAPPPTATAPGLLHWAPRGDLVRDPGLITAARRAWRVGPSYVLWAGRVADGRLVVLQARDGGRLAVAVLGDEAVTEHSSVLRVLAVDHRVSPHALALAIPYDGNVHIPGLEAGEGAAIEHVLVAPGIDRAAERSITGSTIERPGFVVQPLHHGLSDAWLDVTTGGGIPATAIRVYRHGVAVFTGLLGSGLALAPIDAQLLGPPPGWAGLPTATPHVVAADDYIWWAQTCRRSAPQVRMVWSGAAAGFPQPVRLETIRCAVGRATRAAFLSGALTITQLLALLPFRGDALTAVLPGEEQPSSFVIIGSRAVRSIVVGGRALHTRVAVGSLRELRSVRVIR